MSPPILGDADEPLGTGVLGDVGGIGTGPLSESSDFRTIVAMGVQGLFTPRLSAKVGPAHHYISTRAPKTWISHE